MNLTDKQKDFLKKHHSDLISIFEVWIDGLKEQLVDEEDDKKKSVLQQTIREFRDFKNNLFAIGQQPRKDKEGQM